MVKLFRSFSALKPAKVLLLGDFMLDIYTTGEVERISPEGPIPILRALGSRALPGGAGNVVRNIKGLGGKLFPVGRVGNDFAGKRLIELLKEGGVDTSGILIEEGTVTPLKNRLIAEGQQLMRIDEERFRPLSKEVEERVLEQVMRLIDQIEVIAISDYGKGFLTHSLLRRVIALGKERGIPLIVDPKGEDFTKYWGATLIKPNYKEALEAAQLPPGSSLDEIGSRLLLETNVEMVMVTRAEQGISLFQRSQERLDLPPFRSHEVKDVTGAGDTVLAVITMALAAKIDLREALELCNAAAGIAIERLGCVPVSLSELAERLLDTHMSSKIFDSDHLFVLKEALRGKRLTFLEIEGEEGVSNALFSEIARYARKSEEERLLIVTPSPCEEAFLSLLSSLHEVDFVLAEKGEAPSLVESLSPQRVVKLSLRSLFQK